MQMRVEKKRKYLHIEFIVNSHNSVQITNSLLSGVTKTNMKSSCEFLAGENDVF